MLVTPKAAAVRGVRVRVRTFLFLAAIAFLRLLNWRAPAFYNDGTQVQSTSASTIDSDFDQSTPHVRYLLGIFSCDGAKERIRRKTIRNTYLNFFEEYNDYNNNNNNNNNINVSNIICSVHDLLEDSRAGRKNEDCRIVYAFILGANPDGPTDLVDNNTFDPSHPLTISSHPTISSNDNPDDKNYDNDENLDDLVFLNIRENMNDGKSQSYFKYGATIAKHLGIDYIIKADSDTVVFPHQLLREMAAPPMPLAKVSNTTATYGGFPWFTRTKRPCAFSQYYSGLFYFMSTDLAEHITADDCDRRSLTLNLTKLEEMGCATKQLSWFEPKAEDMSLGNFVEGCTKHPVRHVAMGNPKHMGHAAGHEYKDPLYFERYYHVQNLVDKANHLHDENHDFTGIKTAVCHNSLFGNRTDFTGILEWVAYNRLLGFDHVYITYLKGIEENPGFEQLRNLSYVTITENEDGDGDHISGPAGDHSLGGTCDQRCLVENCLKHAVGKYDWVWLADSTEILWYNESIGVKEFLGRFSNYDYLSFGKYMYSTKHKISTQNKVGFLGEEFPFTAKTYCEKRTKSGEVPISCPSYHGLSKIMVRPSVYKDQMAMVQVHGHVHEMYGAGESKTLEGHKAIHLPMEEAHTKEWVGGFSNESQVVTKDNFVIQSKEDMPFPGWEYYLEGTGDVPMYHDPEPRKWLQYVASRGSLGPL